MITEDIHAEISRQQKFYKMVDAVPVSVYFTRMANTTIQIDSARLKQFKEACKERGLLWRPVLDAALDRESRALSQAKIKNITRKKEGSL